MKQIRVTQQRLEDIAFEHAKLIELDPDHNLAFVVVGRTEYMATLTEQAS